MVREAVASDGRSALERPLEHTLGKRAATALAKLELHIVDDLLSHTLFRSAYCGESIPLADVREDEAATVITRVTDSGTRLVNSWRGYVLTVRIADGVNELDLTFFGKSPRMPNFHARRLASGAVASFSGAVSSYHGGLQLTHLEYEFVEDESDVAKIARPIPIHRATDRLPSRHIRKAVRSVLQALVSSDIPDPLPGEYLAAHRLPSKFEATRTLRCPEDDEEWCTVRLRMAHEEAYVLQAALAQYSYRARERTTAPFPPADGGPLAQFDAGLPYESTSGQREASVDITADLAKTTLMHRLLQDDASSGKTIVVL